MDSPEKRICVSGTLRRNVRPEILDFARKNRSTPAAGEAEVWDRVRAGRLGRRFRRQSVIRGWIVDFWCPSKRLVIEIDGPDHNSEPKKSNDLIRDNILFEKLGIYTLRLPLRLVLDDLDGAVELIRREMECRPTKYLDFRWTKKRKRTSKAAAALPLKGVSR